MSKLKHLILTELAIVSLIGLGSIQAKEWEQSYVADINSNSWKSAEWGFSKDSIESKPGKDYSIWQIGVSCICRIDFGSCEADLVHYGFYEYEQNFWSVISKDALRAGTALDLNDSSAFIDESLRNSYILYESYNFSNKLEAENDTNYFVYKKDSSYYALCQYITVYDTVVYRSGKINYIPGFFAHQCIFQNDGSPSFSKIPAFSGVLPEARKFDAPTGIANPVRKPARASATCKPYLVNGQSANGLTAKGVRVEGDRIYHR